MKRVLARRGSVVIADVPEPELFRSDVLVDHCLRSNGGLFYRDRDEFVEGLKLLMSDGRLRAAMGRAGREYVRRNYRWDVVLGKLDRMIARVRQP